MPVCPVCGNLIFSASPAGVQCCGRTLEPQKPRKAEEHQRLHTEPVEDEWYITTDHPMTKTEHIAFAALLSGGSLRVWRQYPEWDFQLRLSRREHGLLVWYSTRDGLLYQLICLLEIGRVGIHLFIGSCGRRLLSLGNRL